MQRGFLNDNVLHTEAYGDIHFSSYIPESYDGTSPYALFVTLPGWEGLYFQGVGANMVEVLAEARTPVYMAIGEDDSYYGSSSLKEAYERLRELYLEAGLTESQIESLVVLEVKDQEYFSEAGFSDQHAGGQAFAHDETIMGWLFGEHEVPAA